MQYFFWKTQFLSIKSDQIFCFKLFLFIHIERRRNVANVKNTLLILTLRSSVKPSKRPGLKQRDDLSLFLPLVRRASQRWQFAALLTRPQGIYLTLALVKLGYHRIWEPLVASSLLYYSNYTQHYFFRISQWPLANSHGSLQ